CGVGAVGRRPAEDGNVRPAPFQSRLVSRPVPAKRILDYRLGADRNHLWRPRRHGAAQHEEADRLLIDQSPRLRGARHLQLHQRGTEWGNVRDAGARRLHGRRHTYEIREFGGLATPMPTYAAFFLFIVLASVGLPLLNGFVGEFLVLSGAFQARAVYGILAATGVIWSACYLLWMYQRVFFGKVTQSENSRLP